MKEEFPESYLDIATVLIRSHIPVYNVTAEKTPPKVWFREAGSLSAEDVNRLRLERQTVETTATKRHCVTEVVVAERTTEPSASKSVNDPRGTELDRAANPMPTEKQRTTEPVVSKRRPESTSTAIPSTWSGIIANLEITRAMIEHSDKDDDDEHAVVSATSIIRIVKESSLLDNDKGKEMGKGRKFQPPVCLKRGETDQHLRKQHSEEDKEQFPSDKNRMEPVRSPVSYSDDEVRPLTRRKKRNQRMLYSDDEEEIQSSGANEKETEPESSNDKDEEGVRNPAEYHEDTSEPDARTKYGENNDGVYYEDDEDSDDDDEAEDEDDDTNLIKGKSVKQISEISAKRHPMQSLKMDHGMYVSPEEANHLIVQHPYIKMIRTSLERDVSEGANTAKTKRQKYIKETLRNCMRLMKFVSPNNTIGNFSWACMAKADRINQFFCFTKNKARDERTGGIQFLQGLI